jgi:hypothetical protein
VELIVPPNIPPKKGKDEDTCPAFRVVQEDGCSNIFPNVDFYIPIYTASYPRKL